MGNVGFAPLVIAEMLERSTASFHHYRTMGVQTIHTPRSVPAIARITTIPSRILWARSAIYMRRKRDRNNPVDQHLAGPELPERSGQSATSVTDHNSALPASRP